MKITTDLICPVCAGEMAEIIPLPRYPITERYEPVSKPFRDTGYVDQAFLFCEDCYHGKLKNIVDPDYLYGKEYTHQTSNSSSSMSACDTFARYLYARGCLVVDIGGSDGYLCARLEASERVIIDPYREGLTFETASELNLKQRSKMIVSSHTLEHIPDVNAFLTKIASLWKEGDVLAISVPGLNSLLTDWRFDQVHHQHVHYFSLRSLGLLLAKHGFGIVRTETDHMHWGSIMVVCDRKARDVDATMVSRHMVSLSYTLFRSFMREIDCKGAIGLGAGLMAPVLRYHMPQLDDIECIVDSDKAKHGKRYINWDKEITGRPISGRKVVVCAVQSKLTVRALVAKAMDEGAREIVVPVRSL